MALGFNRKKGLQLSAEGSKTFKGCTQQYFLRELNAKKMQPVTKWCKEYSSTQRSKDRKAVMAKPGEVSVPE